MADLPTVSLPSRRARIGTAVSVVPALFASAVFSSAALVFVLEPMIAKLILPSLGGAAAVWNTCLAFFQVALLIGYSYAHLLQRVASLRQQTLIHGAVLLAAALVLPLKVSGALGPPDTAQPVFWLIGVLTLSIGLPFAALSATAPLLQAWYARLDMGEEEKPNPYVLYAASNLGSLIALLAYPTLFEPFLRLGSQAGGWSLAYGAFVVMIAHVAWVVRLRGEGGVALAPTAAPAQRTSWRARLSWLALAAIPSSLMLGVTSYISTDIASAPFLWIIPLALYLLSFIIAFQSKPLIKPETALPLQSLALALCILSYAMPVPVFTLQILLHLAGFFLTALVCHQTLVAQRPDPARLTEFYLTLSAGGVVGGMFNAFLAPVIFTIVLEYPLVLALAALVRPWGKEGLTRARILWLALGLAAAVGLPFVVKLMGFGLAAKACLAVTLTAAILVRDRAPAYGALIVTLLIGGQLSRPHENVLDTIRGFFGVVRVVHSDELGGMRTMSHGTTLHGAQAEAPALHCHPLIYYTPATPMGQVFQDMTGRSTPLNIGVVGMGAGSVAAFTRPGDHLRFFEIDPNVIRFATDPSKFSYIKGCAQGTIDWILGDARISLMREPAAQLDLLLVDAFASDSVPTHLLTVEAMRLYLSKIKPDGIVIMHLSNRHLDLMPPVAAIAEAAGGVARARRSRPAKFDPIMNPPEDAVIVAHNEKALAHFAADPAWVKADAAGTRVWTDDYTNLLGALIAGSRRTK